MSDITFGICNFAMRRALRLFSNWKVIGQENVPPDGPLLIVSNHMSNLDPPMIAASMPRRVNFIAKNGIFKPGIRWFLKAYGAYPLNTVEEGNDIQALLWMRQLLRQDRAIVIFPESTRNPYIGMQKAVSGIAFLAAKTQTPILPIGLTGTERLGPLLRVMYPTGDLTVNIGKPFTLPNTKEKLDADKLSAMMDTVMGRVADLLPSEYHGIYSPTGSPSEGESSDS
jgi:1-acyl-sn-glycerol-3-phosphate acyltransferase